jgi:hypothetical protein
MGPYGCNTVEAERRMKSKTQLISTIVFVLGVVLLLGAVALWVGEYRPQGSGTPATASPAAPQTATQTPVPSHTPTSSHTPTPATPSATPTPTTTPTPGPSPTPSPTPTMAPWEVEVLERMQRLPYGAASDRECREVFETYNSCYVYRYARHITRLEWETVFPRSTFYLVKYDQYGGEFVEHHNWLAIKKASSYLSRDDFQLMLELEQVVITDENRETVARAFVLMSLPDYLDEEIVFSDWEEGSWPAGFGLYYNYAITAWTKIQGLKFQWYFLFDEEGLLSVDGFAPERNVGEYIDVPFEELPVPSRQRLKYWRK